MPQNPIGLPAEAAEKVLAAAEEAGVPRHVLLAQVPIGPAPEAISYETLCALYEQAALLTGDAAFGLHVGERTSTRMYGPLGYAVANSGSFGEALTHLSDLQRLWTSSVRFDIGQRRGLVAARYEFAGELQPGRRRHENEQMLAAILTFARWALGEPVAAEEVRFEHAAPDDLSEHRRIFGSRVVFRASATEILFSRGLLARPITNADIVLGELIREQAASTLADLQRREPLLDRLAASVRTALAGGLEISLRSQATALGMGPRTLQRRLLQRGLTFSQLTDEVRISEARRLLETSDLALAQIAFMLGYSQPSAFHRTFRRLSGTTPTQYRNSRRED